MPRTFVAFEADLQIVLDLTDGRSLHVSSDRMTSIDWRKEVAAGETPLTQVIGQAAFAVGLEALRVPSSADSGGRNLVVFPADLHAKNAWWYRRKCFPLLRLCRLTMKPQGIVYTAETYVLRLWFGVVRCVMFVYDLQCQMGTGNLLYITYLIDEKVSKHAASGAN